MGADQPPGRSVRGPARLQPDRSNGLQPEYRVPRRPRWTEPGRQVLADLGLTEFDAEEHQEAGAAEREARRWQDLAGLNDLAWSNFSGPRYELFASALAAYGYPVIRSWIRRGLIYQFCVDHGRPAQVDPQVRLYLMDHTPQANDDRMELSLETNARALTFFKKHVLLKKVWSVDGGAALNTFYIGACLFAFPNVLQRWAGERRRSFPLHTTDVIPEPPQWSAVSTDVAADPADSVTTTMTVAAELRAMPPSTRAVAERVVLGGASFAEVASELGITERAVEGRLYRYRAEANRRQLLRRV